MNEQLDPTNRAPLAPRSARLEMVWVTRGGRLELHWSPAAPAHPEPDLAALPHAVAWSA